MRFLNILICAAWLVIGVGCQSDEARTVSRTSTVEVVQTTKPEPVAPVVAASAAPKSTPVQQFVTDKATYTVEVLSSPSPNLTPTSRAGDQTNHVYSSDIIAVYVHTNSGVMAGSNNATAVPAPANNPQP